MKKSTGIIIASVAVICAAAAGFAIYSHSLNAKMEQLINVDTVYHGISVNGIDVGGLSGDDAYALLEKELNGGFDSMYINVVKDEESWKYTYSDFDGKYDLREAVDEAYDYGREGSTKERYKLVKKLETEPLNVECGFSYSKVKVNDAMLAINKEVSKEAVNSELSRENGRFVITDDQEGYEMDVPKTSAMVCTAIESMESKDVELCGEVIEPEITREENEKSTSLIGTYYTTYSSGNAGRNENLRVGCLNIDGTVVKPGETFSMNEGLGPQTYENGYRNAAVIVNGKIEDGLAGGVCQVTSTLYNAVIRAELEVVQRSNHSLTVAYVPLGLDAAVAGDYKDFKFKNDTDYPVYIEAYTTGSKVVCNVYGYEVHSSGRKVEFESVKVGTIPKPDEIVTEDPELPEGTREVTYTGKEGLKIDTYKKVFENGSLVSRSYFSSSTYRATADEVTVGTGKAASSTESGQPELPSSINSGNTEESGGSIFG